MQLFTSFASITVIIYGFYKFIHKPQDTLEEQHKLLEKRVDTHEIKLNEIEKSLNVSHEKHREQEKTNHAFQSVMLSFVNFEIAYCLHTDYKHTEELIKAKNALEDYINDK